MKSLSYVQFFATPWTIACQAPMSLGFPRQEYWSGLPCPPPGGLPDPEIKTVSLWLLHCRRILYHWATREAKRMLKNLNKVKLEHGWLRCCVCLGIKHELKEVERKTRPITFYIVFHRWECQACYPNLQAKLAYCCFIYPGRRPAFTGSDPKDLLLMAQQAGEILSESRSFLSFLSSPGLYTWI